MTDERRHARPAYTPEDVAQFETLVARYGAHVYAVAYRLAGNEADARDLAQEAFIRAWRALRTIQPGTALEGWFYRIVKNLYIDLVRRKPRQRVQSLDAPLDTGEATVARERPDPAADVERAAADRAIDRRIQAALLALPPDLRAVVVLSDVEGYGYEEIAAMLDIPIGTVKSRLHRARRALRDRLAPHRAELMQP
ncbi:MAG: sigma-70 family RNA polymerase sigma factor [Armatimonadota bacterium]|nr:sigma-70 family RNA polymerase sigma factor [Armatimonadota bacterium]MDR7535176.1 sigma-70 family RNA polymerase sigma factor [Armatimonadota bacterium]